MYATIKKAIDALLRLLAGGAGIIAIIDGAHYLAASFDFSASPQVPMHLIGIVFLSFGAGGIVRAVDGRWPWLRSMT